MPAYDFRCTSCGTVTEVTRRAADDAPVPCPQCGGTTKQLFHPVGVHFKGSGFHNTDYRPKPASESSCASASPDCGG